MKSVFRPLRVPAALALAGLLGACAYMPTGPSVMALPGTGKSFDQFRRRCELPSIRVPAIGRRERGADVDRARSAARPSAPLVRRPARRSTAARCGRRRGRGAARGRVVGQVRRKARPTTSSAATTTATCNARDRQPRAGAGQDERRWWRWRVWRADMAAHRARADARQRIQPPPPHATARASSRHGAHVRQVAVRASTVDARCMNCVHSESRFGRAGRGPSVPGPCWDSVMIRFTQRYRDTSGRAAMTAAETGDDVWGDDPTVLRLRR